MVSRKESDLRPSWRLTNTPYNKKSPIGRWPRKKMLIYVERSRYVYENKQKRDIMPDEKPDIHVDMTWILQKIAPNDERTPREMIRSGEFTSPNGGVKPPLPRTG
jgi:hypothetical protein